MVNYHGSQKAVVRVNPSVPLGTLVPVICEKCDFDTAHVLLLRDSVSRRELPLDKSLSELDIKELYVHDRSLGRVEILILTFAWFISHFLSGGQCFCLIKSHKGFPKRYSYYIFLSNCLKDRFQSLGMLQKVS